MRDPELLKFENDGGIVDEGDMVDDRRWVNIQKWYRIVKWVVKVIEIRWMSSDVNRPDGVDGRRRR